MEHATIIGIDLAKRSFQLHGACADGSVAFRKKLNRDKVLDFMASQPRCVVAMEACASSHHWGREFGKLGHEVKLVPPIYVKPFVKRQKNDAADAEAICEAASRPTMRFVAVKTREQQSQGMLFRTRDLLVRQRTQTINALRGHFAEFGVVAPQGPAHVERLAEAIEDADSPLPGPVRELGALLFVQIGDLDEKIAELERDLRERAREDERTVRLMSVPGIGPLCAMAIQAFAPPLESFRCGRDFAAWLGLVPRQNSTGGKPKLGRISKMGQRDLRRLLVAGAHAGRGGAGQPDGAHRLGADDEERVLPRAAADRLRGKSRGPAPSGMRAGRKMVRANGQRDGVGKTSGCGSAFEHTWMILDSTRVSPYGPAAHEVPHLMRPDTRQHLTACTEPPEEMELPETAMHGFGRTQRPSLRSEASTSRTVTRGCQAAARLLHVCRA